jgi:hypothetical protein
MAGRKRKKVLPAGEIQQPSERQRSSSPTLPSITVALPAPPCPASSSPFKPLAQPTLREAIARPAFERIQLQPFDRRISPNLPQNILFDIFSEFCPSHMVDKWVEYTNARHIFLPNHAEGPRQRHSSYDTWKPTYTPEVYLFLGILIYMSHTQVFHLKSIGRLQKQMQYTLSQDSCQEAGFFNFIDSFVPGPLLISLRLQYLRSLMTGALTSSISQRRSGGLPQTLVLTKRWCALLAKVKILFIF